MLNSRNLTDKRQQKEIHCRPVPPALLHMSTVYPWHPPTLLTGRGNLEVESTAHNSFNVSTPRPAMLGNTATGSV